MIAPATVAVTLPERPYPGLRPFEKEEWAIFFGRERMIDEVIARLAESRLVLIHGISGSGKSSLVRAGVLPKLALQYRRHDAPWLTCEMPPSGGPLWNLAKEFARLESRGGELERVSAIAGQFNARHANLASIAASLDGVEGKSLCLLVDQFEELFHYERETSRDEAELFVDLVQRAATEETDIGPDAVDLHVIVTMRSEFLGECARFAGFAETINRTQYLVPRMDDDGLIRAMRRPAQMYGAEFDDGLAERLIASVRGRVDELPLLQHGLMLMWEDADGRAHVRERARLDGSLVYKAGSLSELLSKHADKVMASVVAPDEGRAPIVEAAFRALTDVNAEGKAIRRPLAFQKLCAIADTPADQLHPILDAFRAPGVSFVTPYAPEPIDGKTVIDISHEALIRCWRSVSAKEGGWLQEEVRDGHAWRALLYQAETFVNDKESFLSEPATEVRAKWLKERNPAWAERYGGGWSKVEALVHASQEHWKREAEIEEANRQREIENERLRREAAEYSALLAKKSELLARRRAQLAFVSFAAAAPIAAFAIWTYQARIWTYQSAIEAYRQSNATPLAMTQESLLKPGDSFKECVDCPEMIVVPAGRFLMGSPADQGFDDARPQHQVAISRPFAIAKFTLTFDALDACAAHGDCTLVSDSGWGRDRRPAIDVSWDDAQTYVKWLSRFTGKPYRLLSEAEYEYAARAGTGTQFPWGDEIKLDGQAMANCDGCGSQWDNRQTAPVGSFAPNRFGLYDMVGNVSEWTDDCWHENYEGASFDGSPWTSDNCTRRVTRGGSWNSPPVSLGSAFRGQAPFASRSNNLGFRVARTLTSWEAG